MMVLSICPQCPAKGITSIYIRVVRIGVVYIMKTRLFKYILKITPKKNCRVSDKNSDIFHISAQNIDCGLK